MKIGINYLYQIKQIKEITDASLTQIELDETTESYPFKNWSDERILCSCYKHNEHGITIYPYVNTDKIQEFENQVLNLQAQVIDLEFEKILGGM